ncbi:MAG: DUF4261 domain-containing protein [Saprospirales bacterium]|nr:DUF4261 domain-containing protein [Saprospirales bacterium]MBK8921130.1 DUF4261 domain-containing protein [Saprospirales bacterium]
MRLPVLFATLFFFFSAFAHAQKTTPTDSKVVSGIVLLNDKTPVNFPALLQAIKKDWGVRLDSSNQSGRTLVLYTTGATIMLANVDYPAAPAEIRSAAEGAWMWRSAREEAPGHQTQVVISVIGSNNRPVQLYKLFTQAAAATLENTRACGVYMPAQYVLQSKDFFLQAAHNLDQNVLPVYCWVYFGMFQDSGATNAYTFGMTEFGIPDLEIVKSRHSMQEAHAVLYDAAKDALQNGKSLHDGTVIETLEGEKITLKLSKSVYLEGQTLKVAY